jgi:hypothetical protein
MFKKQKKGALALVTTFALAYSQQGIFPPPTTNCAAVLCLQGTICVDGQCITPEKEKLPIDAPKDCSTVICPANTNCFQGKCIPIRRPAKYEKPSCENIECESY